MPESFFSDLLGSNSALGAVPRRLLAHRDQLHRGTGGISQVTGSFTGLPNAGTSGWNG